MRDLAQAPDKQQGANETAEDLAQVSGRLLHIVELLWNSSSARNRASFLTDRIHNLDDSATSRQDQGSKPTARRI